jgi:hypothetical protein
MPPICERMTRLKSSQFPAMMETFFRKTGNNKLRFKPAFNPYTEPSMEIFSYHEGLQRWIEVGNVSSHCSLVKNRLRLIPFVSSVGNVPTGNVRAHGFAQGRACPWMGNVVGTTNDDQVSHTNKPGHALQRLTQRSA